MSKGTPSKHVVSADRPKTEAARMRPGPTKPITDDLRKQLVDETRHDVANAEVEDDELEMEIEVIDDDPTPS